MNVHIVLFRVFLLVALIGSCLCLAHGNGDHPVAHIARNIAWNDLINQNKFLPGDSPQDSLDKVLLTRHALVYKRLIGIWKLYEMNCPTGKGKQGSGDDK